MPYLLDPSIAAPLATSKLSSRTAFVHTSALVGICVFAFFVGLGSTPFWEPDEPRFADATREMLRSGDYLQPSFNGQPRWEKPILLYWMQALPMRAGLGAEWSARLPAALAGLVATLGVYLLGLSWWSGRAGLVAAAAFATSFRVATYARQGLTDMPAVAAIVLTFLAFEYSISARAGRHRRAAWWSAWILVGVTALIKGPLALIAPVIWVATTRLSRPGVIQWRNAAAGALVASMIGASWFGFMAAVHGRSFLDLHLGYEIVQRFADASFPGKTRGPLFFWQILPGELAPWSVVMLTAMAVAAVQWRRLDAHVLLAGAWFAGVMLLCSMSRYKLPHYALPAYPAAFLVLGFVVDRLAHGTSGRVMAAALGVTAGAAIAAAGLGLASLRVIPPGFAAGVAMTALMLLAGSIAVALLRKRLEAAMPALAGAAALAYASVAAFVLPPLADFAYPYPGLGRVVAERAPSSATLSALGEHTALVYYADRDVTFVETPEAIARLLDSQEPRLAVLTGRNLAAATAALSHSPTILASGRLRNPRLSHLRDGRFLRGSDDVVLVGNAAAVEVWKP